VNLELNLLFLVKFIIEH